MPVLLFDHSEVLAGWCAKRIAYVGDGAFGPCQAIGVASGYGSDDQLYAVVVFHDYQPTLSTIQVSMAATTPKWLTRGVIQGILHYPFQQLGVFKIWGAIPHENKRALRMNLGIGLRQDGLLRHHFGKRHHAVIVSMLKTEYERSKWFVDLAQKAEAA